MGFVFLAERNVWTENSCGGVQMLNCDLSNSVLRIKLVEVVQVAQSVCSNTKLTKNDTCLRLFLDLRPKFLAEVRTICEGRNQCNISAESLPSDPCPLERKYIKVKFKCEVVSTAHPGKPHAYS
jgi:hypothetical protein